MRKTQLKNPKLVTFMSEKADDDAMRKIAKKTKRPLGRLMREAQKMYLAAQQVKKGDNES